MWLVLLHETFSAQWPHRVESFARRGVESQTFEYTIMVIHEYLNLINDLEILRAVRKSVGDTRAFLRLVAHDN